VNGSLGAGAPEPPFWAQADSVQIMAWTRQIG
jgi:hypothetical protein